MMLLVSAYKLLLPNCMDSICNHQYILQEKPPTFVSTQPMRIKKVMKRWRLELETYF